MGLEMDLVSALQRCCTRCAERRLYICMTKFLCDRKTWEEIGELPRPDEALKSGDFHAALNGFALEHFLKLRETRTMTSDESIIGFGTALWLLGDRNGAASVWARVCDEAIKGRYTHSSNGTFQGGLLLWFASVWLKKGDWENKPEILLDNLHDLANDLLEKLLSKKKPMMGASFAASLAKLLRREIDLAEVETGYTNVPLLKERRQSMALFYAGVRAFEEGNTQETMRLWTQVGKPRNSLVELEHYLLVAERERLSMK